MTSRMSRPACVRMDEASIPSSTRSGFSLVLSLVVMSFLVLTLLTLSAFVTVESQAARHHQLATRARLNGTAALRLALAHLQQEAGPDRRATARADFTASHAQPGRNWNQVLNPMWTGVWRNDQPDSPPAWLISGRHDRPAGAQSVSLSATFDPSLPEGGTNVRPDYPESVWLPWQTDYVPPAAQLVRLVGDATATGPADATPSLAQPGLGASGRPDGRVSLPRVAWPDSAGHYAYWIGDEGVKIRVDTRDDRVDGPTADAASRAAAVKGPGRVANEMLPGLPASLTADGWDGRTRRLNDLALAPPSGLSADDAAATSRRLWPFATTLSRGILTDSQWGGLKVDLSSLFEASDSVFRNSEYGAGAGASTYAWQPWDVRIGTGPNLATPAFADNRALVRFTEPGWPADHLLASTYAFRDPRRSTSMIRGPLWEALRSHHLLYRELTPRAGATPELRARAHFPNTVSLAGNINASTAHYGHLYNRMDTAEDMWATETVRGTPSPQPTKPGVFPYVARQLLVFGLQDFGGELRLTLSPVTVLHNPYNVALRLSPENSGDAAMRLSFRFWDQWFLEFGTSAGGSWSKDLLNMVAYTGGNPNRSESMRVYVPPTTLEPGELKVFSLPGPAPVPFDRIGTTVDRFDFLGGFWAPCLTAANEPLRRNETDTLSVRLRSAGPFYVRHMISSWRGDRLNEAGNANDAALYNASSEVTELLSNSLDASRSGEAPAKLIPPSAVLPGPGQPAAVLAVMDYAARWPADPQPFPLFTRSNPLAPMTRPEATGWSPGGMPAGYATTSSSFRMTIRGVNDWTEVMETDLSGRKAFGGLSHGSQGVPAAVFTAVPLVPPVSLAEYGHANVHLRDQDPLLAAGNSFASPFFAKHQTWNYRSAQNCTDVDRSYWLNAALFDRHFLSGAGPEWNAGRETKPMATVLDEFFAGRRALANPRIKLAPQHRGRGQLNSHRTLAGAVTLEGAFNVNNVSPDAWAALLGATKGLPSGSAGPTSPAADRNARYPRADRRDAAVPAHRPGFLSEEAWNGLRSLDDRQIQLLAKAIVDEIRWRSQYPHRTEAANNHRQPEHDRPKSFRGATAGSKATVPLPFQGLAQFVNRFTCNTYPFIGNAGCLQNAIHRADNEGAELTRRGSALPPPSTENEQRPLQGPGQVPWTDPASRANLRSGDPRGAATGQARMTEGAPGSLTQADILEVIGPALCTRSDTFVLRVYADAVEGGESSRVWIEAVVQRTAEFCDSAQPPETPVTHPGDARLAHPSLRAVNRLLGRRFTLVSARTLRPEEL